MRYPAVADTMGALRATLNEASADCDLILTSGGVSMGEFDYVRRIMEEEGDIHFWRMKFVQVTSLFGLWNSTPLFGLPGNPVSSHVVFRMLVAPYLRHALGTDGPKEWTVRAKLCDAVKSTNDCVTLRRVTLTSTEEGMMAHQPRHQGSGNLESLASASGLTLLQPGSRAMSVNGLTSWCCRWCGVKHTVTTRTTSLAYFAPLSFIEGATLRKMLTQARVVVNGEVVHRAKHILHEGDEIEVLERNALKNVRRRLQVRPPLTLMFCTKMIPSWSSTNPTDCSP